MNHFWDRLGISASILCLIHCLLTPVLVLFSPILGQIFPHLVFHILIAFLVFPVAIYALFAGYKAHHDPKMLRLGCVGLFFILLSIGAGLADDTGIETATMVCAGLFLTSAHLLNLRACRHLPTADLD